MDQMGDSWDESLICFYIFKPIEMACKKNDFWNRLFVIYFKIIKDRFVTQLKRQWGDLGIMAGEIDPGAGAMAK